MNHGLALSRTALPLTDEFDAASSAISTIGKATHLLWGEFQPILSQACIVQDRPKTRSVNPAPRLLTDWNLLLNNAKAGVDADRNRLFELLRERLLTVALFRLRGASKEDIDDIVQNSLVVVVAKLDGIDDNPHYFALDVLYKKIGGVIREKKRRQMISLNPTGAKDEQNHELSAELQLPSDSYEEMLDHMHESEIADKLKRSISKLSPLCQAIFLALLQFKTVADVWAIYQEREPKLSRNAFDKRLFDCRRKLRDLTSGQLA